MFASLRALLEGVIDYAGLFPPAKLPLDQAVRNYLRYRREPEAWMLGRFVIPATRLGELSPHVRELPLSGPPLVLTVVGRTVSRADEVAVALPADVETISAFQGEYASQVAIAGIELRIFDDAQGAYWILAPVHTTGVEAQLHIHRQSQITPFYEMPSGAEWREAGSTVISALAGQNKRLPHRRENPAGFKLRCGGLEASAFPSPEQVAFFITVCRDAGVPLKFTAGLHHPIRHFDAGLQTKMHGFLNVFVAGVLAHARRLSEEQVRQVIEDEDASHFVFDDAGLRWKGLRATTDEIVTARREPVTSFGSCSFDEPRDDLRALGLLP